MKKLKFQIAVTIFLMFLNALMFGLGFTIAGSFPLGIVNGLVVLILTRLLVMLLNRLKQVKNDG